MECRTHTIPLQLICDEYVCAMCYQDTILSEKLFAKDQDFELIAIDDPSGHHGKKVKAFRNGKEL